MVPAWIVLENCVCCFYKTQNTCEVPNDQSCDQNSECSISSGIAAERMSPGGIESATRGRKGKRPRLMGLSRRSTDIAVTDRSVRRIATMDRKTRYKAINALEKGGLIQVVRQRGKAPRATILDLGSNSQTGTMEQT